MFVTTNPLEILIFAAKNGDFWSIFHAIPWTLGGSQALTACLAALCPAPRQPCGGLLRRRGAGRDLSERHGLGEGLPLMPRPTSSC